MKIDEMQAGREMDALVAGLMETKPLARKTYRQLEKEDTGEYSCWTISSPNEWWEINIDWGTVEKNKIYDEVPEWEPAKEPSEDIAAAWAVEEKIKERGAKMQVAYTTELILTVGSSWKFDLVHATPEQRCRAALKAVTEKEERS